MLLGFHHEKSISPARWCSGESILFPVGRPGVHSLNRVILKDFKKSYSNKMASLHVVSFGKALNGTPPSLCGRQVAPPVLHQITIVKLLTQHVVKDDSWVPTNGSTPCWWWGYQSLKTGPKWAAIFPLD